MVRLMSIHQAKGLEFPVVFVPDFAATSVLGTARRSRGGTATYGCLVKVPSEFDSQPEEEQRPVRRFANDLGRTADQLADWQEDLRILYVACTRASRSAHPLRRRSRSGWAAPREPLDPDA